MHHRIFVRLHFRRSGLDVPSDTRDRKPDQCVGKRIAEVVVQSDSCVRTREEKQKRSSGRWNFMDSDSFVILSCTGGNLICCRKGSSGSTVPFGNLLVLPDICGAVSCRRK